MYKTVTEALKNAELYSDGFDYRFVKMPPNAITAAAGIVAQAGNPFIALIVDKDEVTLMIENEEYHQFKKRMLDHTVSETHYRLITFDVELDSSLVGFMARISTTLANADISLMPYAAFKRDHIFVAADHYERAISILENLT